MVDDDDDLEFLKSLQEEFFAEALDAFEDMESLLLNINSSDDKDEKLKELMRLLHSMKGSAHATDLPDMATYIHKIESNCAGTIDESFVDTALQSIDVLKEYVQCLKDDDTEKAATLLS